MKLSEAIRLGAMLRPLQAFDVLFNPETGATCAMGAAGEAVGVLDTSRRNAWKTDAKSKAPKEWRWVVKPASCPLCGDVFDMPVMFPRYKRDTQAVIVHLNNDHRWTRERIADWVQGIEETLSTEPNGTTGEDSACVATAVSVVYAT